MKPAAHPNDDWWGGVSASRVPAMNTSVPSISSRPSSCVQHTNIRNIALCSFLTSFVHWKSRDARCSKALYTALFARCAIFFLFSLSLCVCTRLSKPRFRLEKRTRYVSNYESRVWVHRSLAIDTRLFITFFSFFFPSDILFLDLELWEWKGIFDRLLTLSRLNISNFESKWFVEARESEIIIGNDMLCDFSRS